MSYIVLLRHGQSQWNLENRFTGFRDVDLSEQGRKEAAEAGKLIKKAGLKFDKVFTSTLKRAYTTGEIALRECEQENLIPLMVKHDDLRERDYGDLTGLNKDETKQKYGEEQVHIWRRSYDVQPPGGESLKDVVENRVRPYYSVAIKPLIENGNNILIAAHGNSLRALLIILGENTPENINQTEIPTGSPLVIEFDGKGNRTGKYYLHEKFSLESLEALVDETVDKVKAAINDNGEKLAEATRQGIIKGADAVKRAAENPEATKEAVKEAVSTRWDRIKSIFGGK